MTALKRPNTITIAEYLAGEAISDVKHDEFHNDHDTVILLPEIDARLALAEHDEQVNLS